MVHFRKRLTPKILGEINEMIIAKAENKGDPPSDNPSDGGEEPPSEGDLLVDATCAPQTIATSSTYRCSTRRVKTSKG